MEKLDMLVERLGTAFKQRNIEQIQAAQGAGLVAASGRRRRSST